MVRVMQVSATPRQIPMGVIFASSIRHGQELKYEIANWNTSGESQVWVRVPSLTNDSNFTMLWGNSAATLPAYANDGSAWSDYFGVYHLEGGSGNAVDSSPLNNDLPGVTPPPL